MAANNVSVPVIRVLSLGKHRVGPVAATTARVNVSPSIKQLLAEPSWSVRSLLPPQAAPHESQTTEIEQAEETTKPEITREKLHHLLRLSALPQPKTEDEEKSMLKMLESQIHFVKEIQKVDTTGIEPLQMIRDETDEGIKERTFKLQDLMPYLEMEEKVGKNGTVRRRKDVYKRIQEKEKLDWDPFELGVGSEERKRIGGGGRYFVVKRRKPGSTEEEKSLKTAAVQEDSAG